MNRRARQPKSIRHFRSLNFNKPSPRPPTHPFPSLPPPSPRITWPARSNGKLPFSGGLAWMLAPPKGFMLDVVTKPA